MSSRRSKMGEVTDTGFKRSGKSLAAKRQKIDPIPNRSRSSLFVFGRGEFGQLGLGPAINRRHYPTLVEVMKDKKVIQVVAGGMHTVVLEEGGNVWTFGCNDDCPLGRETAEEEDNFDPGQVDFGNKRILQVSAGDSHSAALAEDGDVYAWGTFRTENGVYGLIPGDDRKCFGKPQLISANIDSRVVKIVSGDNHIVMLTEDGVVFSCGTSGQGQLGRFRRVTRATTSSEISERDYWLTPSKVIMLHKVNDIWAGNYATCLVTDRNVVFACGLNNFFQLGVKGSDNEVLQPIRSTRFNLLKKKWNQFAVGQHHIVALDEEGKVYSIGNGRDGRLGLGDEVEDEVDCPTLVPMLMNVKCKQVAAGTTVSYAVTEDGKLYSWGSGVNFQLGTGNDDDLAEPKRLENMVIGKSKQPLAVPTKFVSGGGQHAVVLLDMD